MDCFRGRRGTTQGETIRHATERVQALGSRDRRAVPRRRLPFIFWIQRQKTRISRKPTTCPRRVRTSLFCQQFDISLDFRMSFLSSLFHRRYLCELVLSIASFKVEVEDIIKRPLDNFRRAFDGSSRAIFEEMPKKRSITRSAYQAPPSKALRLLFNSYPTVHLSFNFERG